MKSLLFICVASIFFMGSLQAKQIKVGFLLSTMQEERYQKDKKYFEAEVKRLGGDVVFNSARNSERVQVKKLENMLLKGVDVVVIQPVNSNAASTLAELAAESNVPVIAYDRLIKNAKIAAYVTQDSVAVGRIQAEEMVRQKGEKGRVVLLQGQSGHSVANAISKGVKDVLNRYPNIEIVVEKSHDNWSPALAMATVENALTKHKGNITAVIANNSGMANGAVQAIADYDEKLLGKIFVAGADADLAAVKNILAGHQQFEVLKDFRLLAEKSAQVAITLAKTGKIPATSDSIDNNKIKVPVFNTAVFPVTSETIDSIVIGRGFHSKADVYGRKSH